MNTARDRRGSVFLDEAATRLEIARMMDVCVSCRRCADLCAVFPAMFGTVDEIGRGGAGQMTPNQQDSVLGACHRCTLCTAGCPFGPGRHPDNVDIHAVIGRWHEMRRANGLLGLGERLRLAFGRSRLGGLGRGRGEGRTGGV